MKVTRRGLFAKFGAVAGVATLAPLVGTAKVSSVFPTRFVNSTTRQAMRKAVYGTMPGEPVDPKKLWPDLKKWWTAKYDELPS